MRGAHPDAFSLPVAARIVNADGELSEGEIGNVRVTFADGHNERWTRRGGYRLPKVSAHGLVGWIRDHAARAHNGSRRSALILLRDGRVVARIRTAPGRTIEGWDFAEDGDSVVVLSESEEHSSWFTLYRIRGARKLAECSSTTSDLPAWARRLAEADREGKPRLVLTIDDLSGPSRDGSVIFTARALGATRDFGLKNGKVILYDGDYVEGPIPIEISGRDASGHVFSGTKLWLTIPPGELTGKGAVTLTREPPPAPTPTPAPRS